MSETNQQIGKPLNRVDGPLKVTGGAKYAAEFFAPDLVYGCIVNSTIAKGKVTRIDDSAARALDGVLLVLTHDNRIELPSSPSKYTDQDARSGEPFRVLYDANIKYSGQPVALVVATSFELARHAARLVHVEYSQDAHNTDLRKVRHKAKEPAEQMEPPASRGHGERAFKASALRTDFEYSSPVEHHNPMEPHASTVVRSKDGSLTIFDKTQGPENSQTYVCNVFGLPKEKVRVLAPFVGGAFGSGLRPQHQLPLAVMAALMLERSVRVVLTRQQMFSFGHRPETLQRVALGAKLDGTLEAIVHEVVAETSQFEQYSENVVGFSAQLYQCDNVQLSYKAAAIDTFTPLDMRAPGAVLGLYALESALDELSYAAQMDPIELRLKNYAERDQAHDLPYSSKALRACYAQGAARFGWARRPAKPRSLREGHELVGLGMATGMWEAQQQKASARAVLDDRGKLVVSSATTDIGTGTYTIMCQIAAETLGVPIEDVRFELGDTSLPKAPLQGGSWTAASVGSAVQQACSALKAELHVLAKGAPHASYAELLRASGVPSISRQVSCEPNEQEQQQYTRAAHSAVFVEVKVDEALGTVRVTRVVSAIAGGRILNPKTARSQILGAVVWGIGMALHEETLMDQPLGRFMNHTLAEYHIPVNMDVHDIDVIFVDEPDTIVNPLGVKGLGEIGIVGVAAAIANAVYHATGTRIRALPITLDKLL
jgi:xanthine dehydrogenase YagR molybdenum-binding subunit